MAWNALTLKNRVRYASEPVMSALCFECCECSENVANGAFSDVRHKNVFLHPSPVRELSSMFSVKWHFLYSTLVMDVTVC